MRKELIECQTITEAFDLAPWACQIVEVEGGYMAFESRVDYVLWTQQR